jgi:hypothetical protein
MRWWITLVPCVLSACAAWTPEQIVARGARSDMVLRGDYRTAADCALRTIRVVYRFNAAVTFDDAARRAEILASSFGAASIVVQIVEGPGTTTARIYARGDAAQFRDWLRPCV